jgi:uncharacterized protein involved in exopolysaccharide biosynthesis
MVEPPERAAAYEDEIDVRDLFLRLGARKWLIALCTALGAALSLAYALTAVAIYRAEATLSIREDDQTGSFLGAASQLGGLADLAGLSIPGSKDKSVAVATLKSRALIEQFIADNKLVDVLLGDADGGNLPEEDKRTVWYAHRAFVEDIFTVTEDKKSGLITVAVEWRDPKQATDWVTDIVARTNAHLRRVAIEESEKNLAYLEAQAKSTNVIEIRQALFRLAETEIKKLMLAKGAGEYVFKTVDPARVPERKIRPKRVLIAIIGTLLGGFAGVFLALILQPKPPRKV